MPIKSYKIVFYPIFAYRLLRVTLHLLLGGAQVLLLFPNSNEARRNEYKRKWSVRMLELLEVNVAIKNAQFNIRPEKGMIVANHISWIDIFLINAYCPACFITKSEIRSWPLIGWLTAKTGNLFIARNKKSDLVRIREDVTQKLMTGNIVVLFPEGGTTKGNILKHFHTPLLQSAIDSQTLIWPTAIRFLDSSGGLNTAPSFADVSLFKSFLNVVKAGSINAELLLDAPLVASEKNRNELGFYCYKTIANLLGIPLN